MRSVALIFEFSNNRKIATTIMTLKPLIKRAIKEHSVANVSDKTITVVALASLIACSNKLKFNEAFERTAELLWDTNFEKMLLRIGLNSLINELNKIFEGAAVFVSDNNMIRVRWFSKKAEEMIKDIAIKIINEVEKETVQDGTFGRALFVAALHLHYSGGCKSNKMISIKKCF